MDMQITLLITHCIHVLKCYTVPNKYVQLPCQKQNIESDDNASITYQNL